MSRSNLFIILILVLSCANFISAKNKAQKDLLDSYIKRYAVYTAKVYHSPFFEKMDSLLSEAKKLKPNYNWKKYKYLNLNIQYAEPDDTIRPDDSHCELIYTDISKADVNNMIDGKPVSRNIGGYFTSNSFPDPIERPNGNAYICDYKANLFAIPSVMYTALRSRYKFINYWSFKGNTCCMDEPYFIIGFKYKTTGEIEVDLIDYMPFVFLKDD